MDHVDAISAMSQMATENALTAAAHRAAAVAEGGGRGEGGGGVGGGNGGVIPHAPRRALALRWAAAALVLAPTDAASQLRSSLPQMLQEARVSYVHIVA